MHDLVILGTGGNCLDIVDAVEDLKAGPEPGRFRVRGFLDDNPATHGTRICGLPVLGPLAMAATLTDCLFVNGIGSPRNFWKKPAIIAATAVPRDRFATVIHPSACVSRFAEIGPGSVLLQHVTVNARAKIGAHVIVLPGVVISHDDQIGDYTCIASAACLAGDVKVGEACYLGSHCSINGGVTLGAHTLVGMGAVVLRDTPERSVMVGNPARVLRSTY
ncbi:MAG: acetyltransferase [Verrucomicrobia bacterium]|jgi:sugar O-acyltransferase (sialic acid O-acetyltransferase NeuD family)|nr:acetyltransferase [Verrucomicrobiota bacterium]